MVLKLSKMGYFSLSPTPAIDGTTSSILTLGTKSGTYRVTAQGSMQATFTATAILNVLARIDVSPQSPEIVIKRQLLFTAAGYDQYNNALGELIYNWQTVGGIGSLTSTKGTSTTLMATSTSTLGTITAGTLGVTGSSKVTIIYGQLTSVTVTPSGAEVEKQGTQSFTAQGFNQYGDPIIGVAYTWTLNPAEIGTFNTTVAQTVIFTGVNPGTGNIQVRAVFGTHTVTAMATISVISKQVKKLGFTVGTLTAWMPGTITIQLQDNLGNSIPATTATTIIVSGDAQSRFATASSGVIWNNKGTFTVEAGTTNVSFFFKQNGTSSQVIIMASITGTNISGTISVTIVQPVTGSSSGTVVGDDGQTRVIVVVGAVEGQGVIAIDTNPATTTETTAANNADDIDETINRVEGTMREFEINNATITATGVWIVIPYPDANNDGVVDNMTPAVDELTLEIYRLVGSQWVVVPGSVVDPVNNTVSAFVTDMSYFIVRGKVKMVEKTLTNVIVYPNPCKPHLPEHDKIIFDKLTAQCKIQICNIAGELIYEEEFTETQGRVEWNLRNKFGKRVSSGVYFYIITNPAGEKVIDKLAVIR